METVLPFCVFADRRGHVVALKVGELQAEEARLILDRLQDLDHGTPDPGRPPRSQIAAGLGRLNAARAAARRPQTRVDSVLRVCGNSPQQSPAIACELRYIRGASLAVDCTKKSHTAMARVLLLNGPNLNLLGTREPAVYGTDTLEAIEQRAAAVARETGHELVAFQSNAEHELIERIHRAKADGGGRS